ncbi:MAG: penicillin-binding protein 1A [Flavobacteriales bacterium]|jgi:penicillin-binding protein 1A
MRKKIILFFLKLFLIGAAFLTIFILAVNGGVFGHLYDKKEIKSFKNETASLVYASNKELIGKIFAENRTNISYQDLPKDLINALVATEDARFFEHSGIDSRSLLRVFFKTFLMNDKRSGGGSTISQQLAKNMYGRKTFGLLTMPVNKTKEALLAYRIETVYNKEEILTLYLNTVPFGENVYGIGAAAKRFFNKSVSQLKLHESAVLVGMLKANTYYNPRVHPDHAIERRNVVLAQMAKYDYLTEELQQKISKYPLGLKYANLSAEGPAPYFLSQVKSDAKELLKEYTKKDGTAYDIEKDGLRIITTLDLQLQKAALKGFGDHLKVMQRQLRKQYKSGRSLKEIEQIAAQILSADKLKSTTKRSQELFEWDGIISKDMNSLDSLIHSLTMLHAGLLALEPDNGAIRAYIGGIHFRSQPYDQVKAKRQLASSFKPILYAAALEAGIPPCDYLDNDTLVLEDYDNWSPQNYDKSTGGKYSMKAALSKSMNIPTVNLYLQTGYEPVDYVWQKMGFSSDLPNLPATALGTVSANVFEMATAYASFANGGFKINPYSITRISDASGKLVYRTDEKEDLQRILEESTALVINEMLQAAVDSGTGRSIRSRFQIDMPLAAKTGTSQNYADAWFVAYNPSLVIVTRVGASNPSIHFNSGSYGAGSTLALPIVAKTLQQIERKSNLNIHYGQHFPSLPLNLAWVLMCPDKKKELNLINYLENLFKGSKDKAKEEIKNSDEKPKSEKKSFWERLFD